MSRDYSLAEVRNVPSEVTFKFNDATNVTRTEKVLSMHYVCREFPERGPHTLQTFKA
jgi:hypothetical protein